MACSIVTLQIQAVSACWTIGIMVPDGDELETEIPENQIVTRKMAESDEELHVVTSVGQVPLGNDGELIAKNVQ